MVKKYKTKPCEIEAIQWKGDNLEEIKEFTSYNIDWDYIYDGLGKLLGYKLYIDTLEGRMQASEGDYIIKGLRGEFYPCKPDVFEKKYEVIEELKGNLNINVENEIDSKKISEILSPCMMPKKNNITNKIKIIKNDGKIDKIYIDDTKLKCVSNIKINLVPFEDDEVTFTLSCNAEMINNA